MKKSIKTILVILLFVITGTSVYSQVQTDFRFQNQVKFNEASKPSDMEIEVTSDQCQFEINVSCNLKKGDLKIEIYDEKGKKQGSFSTGGEVDKKNTTGENEISLSQRESKTITETQKAVSGRLVRDIASIGTWTIRIIPSNATGEFNLMYRQLGGKGN